MKTFLLPLQKQAQVAAFTGKLSLLAFIGLFCFGNELHAGDKTIYKSANVNNARRYHNKGGGKISKNDQKPPAIKANRSNFIALPTISYSGPQTYTYGVAIAALTPTATGVAVAGYYSPVVLGSGFNIPAGAAVDAAGNVYVADEGNNAVKKIPAAGGSPVIIGSGFNSPTGVAVDALGNIYVADNGNNAVKEIPVGGGAPLILGSGFIHPAAVAVDAAGNVFVADYGNNAIKEIPIAGGTPVILGSGFSAPGGVAVDALGNVYVADTGNSLVKKIPVGGGAPVSIGSGFNGPAGIFIDASGNIYVADAGNNAIKEIPAGGGAPVSIGSGFNSPGSVVVDGTGKIYVADQLNNAVKKIKPSGGYYAASLFPAGLSVDANTGAITGTPLSASPVKNYTITAYNAAGSASATIHINVIALIISYSSPQTYTAGTAIAALAPIVTGMVPSLAYSANPVTIGSGFFDPAGVAVDAAGNVYVADFANNAIKKMPPGGGTPVTIGSGFNRPTNVAVDVSGNVYVCDSFNNAIKMIPIDGGAPVLIASGFNSPQGLTLDAAGNIYVSDTNNNLVKEIPAGGGAIVTIASGFSDPSGIAIDPAGNLYVADYGNDAIKKIPAGGGAPVIFGSGFSHPGGVKIDASGNIYVVDLGNNAIKKFHSDGSAMVVIGAGFSAPNDVAIDGAGNVYVADFENNAVKEVSPIGGYFINLALPPGLMLNANSGVISGTPTALSPVTNYTITAFNPAGSSSATLTIKVNLPPLPAISYSGPQTYVAGTAITALAPTSANVDLPGHSNSPVSLGSGLLSPTGVAIDLQGNVYVADYGSSAVKKIPFGGGATVIIGSGFSHPTGVAVDASGNVYVTDEGNKVVKKIPAGGGATVVLASGFTDLIGVAVDPAGNVYASDQIANTVSEIPVGGGPLVSLGSGFKGPDGLAIDAAGDIYVADYLNNAVKKIPAGGGAPVTIGSGFAHPTGVAIDASGNVYVADHDNNAVKVIPAGGGAIVTIGSGFNVPFGVACDGAGNVYVADQLNNAVKEIKPIGGYYISPALPSGLNFDSATGIISGTPMASSPATNYTVTAYNLVGKGSASLAITVNLPPLPTISYSSPQTCIAGTAITALTPTTSAVDVSMYSNSRVTVATGFNIPGGVAVDAAGNIYVGDYGNSVVKKIPFGGGSPVTIGSGFLNPNGVAVDAAGNVYVADQGNNLVKKIPVGGGAPVTLGSGFSTPAGVAVDGAGNVYVADFANHAVKKIPVGGGAPFTLGSGFKSPRGIAVDGSGNVYVADNGLKEILEIPAGGGNPLIIAYGVVNPQSVAVDGSGNLYTFDFSNLGIAKILRSSGQSVTLSSGLNNPSSLAVDGAGNILLTNFANNNLEEIKPLGGYYIGPFLPAGLNFDNATGIISGTPTSVSPAKNYTVTACNVSGKTSATLNITVNLPPLPAISYSGPQTYTAGTAIAALVPVSANVAVPAYSTAPVTLGSGFKTPGGIAVDAAGNIYVGDSGNNAVKKIPAGGGAPVTLGSGFSSPEGVAVDAAGNVYVADYGNGLVKKIPVGGGAPVTLGSGFVGPYGVAVDAAGNVYVADFGNGTIKKIPAGGGTPLSISSNITLFKPTGIAVDAAGNIYVADDGDNYVIKIPAGGGSTIAFGGGYNGSIDVAADIRGNVYVTDAGNNAIIKVPAGGGPQVTLGSGFNYPSSVAADGAGNIFVADYGSNSVKELAPSGGYFISPLLPAGLSFDAGTGIISGTPAVASPAINYTITAYNPAGKNSAILNIGVTLPPLPVISYNSPQTYIINTAITALAPISSNVDIPAYSNFPVSLGSGFNNPGGVAVDAAGNIYVGDVGNNVVKKIPVGGGAPVIIGTGFASPEGVAVDAPGNVYVADWGNSAVKLIPAGGGTIVTLGSGFNHPYGVAVDAAGNVYVADASNGAVKEIPAGGGAVVTLASGLALPAGVAVDAAGNVYVSDIGDSLVKMIPVGGGAIVTLGSGFANPYGVAVDAAGNVYVADSSNRLVKEIPVGGGGFVTPIAIGGAGFKSPTKVAVDASGNVFVADQQNTVIKEIKPVGGYYISGGLPAGLSFNNATGIISGTPTQGSPLTNYTIIAYNAAGSASANVSLKVGSIPFPAISYNSPQTYAQGKAITPLVPTGSGVAAPGYSGSPVTLGSGFSNPTGVAIDGAGNIYVADEGDAQVKKIPAGGGLPVVVGSGFNNPAGVAVDAAGNVYIADNGNNAIYELPVGGGNPLTLATGFNNSIAVAVDIAGNVYVADAGATVVKKIPFGGGAQVSLGSGFSTPASVAVDAAGNVYVADYGSNAIKKIPAGGGAPVTIASGFNGPSGVAVDAAGNVFVSDFNNSAVKEIPVGGGSPIAIGGAGFNHPFGVTVDAAGNVLVADDLNSLVKQITPIGGYYINQALPSGLNFNGTTGVISGTPAVKSPATNYTITAYNGTGGKSATVNINVIADATLAALKISSGALSPAFAAATASYTASVGNGITSINITPTASDAAAAIKVNGLAVVSGTASASIPLVVGPNTITTVVTAEDGITTKTYTITIKRAVSSNTNLSNLKINGGAIAFAPVFVYTTTNYAASVPYSTASVTITPFIADANTIAKVNGTTVASKTASPAIPLNAGPNVINTVTTAQDGVSAKTYTITITRAPAASADLANLALTSGVLSPVFASGTLAYTTSVNTNSIRVTPTAVDAAATIKVNGVIVSQGIASGNISLAIGQNIITTVVTAKDGLTTKTYTVTVTRLSSNTDLSNLAINNGTVALSPLFHYTTTGYTANVTNAVASITITAVIADASAIAKVNGMAIVSGTASPAIPLNAGPNIISTVVTAQDGVTTKTYTITVTRAPSTDASLGVFKLSSGVLSPVFAPSTTSYTASVKNGVTFVTVTPTTDDVTATVKVNGAVVASGSASLSLPLAVGPNAIITIVTAQDGVTTKTYTITVTRAPSSNTNLANLTLSNGAVLSPVFHYTTTSYTASVGNAITTIKVTPTPGDLTATAKVNGTAVASGTASAAIPLAVGPNIINTVITAQDGVTTQTYTITVTRAAGPINIPDQSVSVEKPMDNPQTTDDGIIVHQGVSPNGDGVNDFLVIEGISAYPDNKLMIMSRNGILVYEAKGYDNSSRVFEGRSNKTGARQLPGTYFYSLDYVVKGISKRKTGFIILKY